MRRTTRRRWIVLLCCVIALISWPAHAEVAVAVSQEEGATEQRITPYILSIIDDIDPIGSRLWVPFNTSEGSRVLLNAGGFENGDGPPSIARDSATGVPLVVWSRNSPEGYDVVLSTFRDGAWTVPVVLAGSAADELDPALVIDPATGTVHLLYWVAASESRVMWRSAPSDLTVWSVAQRVSLMGESARRPAGVLQAGTLRVVYESQIPGSNGGGSREVVLATHDVDGFTTEVVASVGITDPLIASAPRIHAIGDRLWVEWIDGEGEMAWMTRVADGPWEGSNTETFADVEERDYDVRQRIRAAVRDLLR